jgi:hypothetical protein
VEAIYHEEDLPARWSAFTGINAEFFTPTGAEGAAEAGRSGPPDPDAVRRLPVRKSR